MLWLVFLTIIWLLFLLIADGYDLQVAGNRGQVIARLILATLGAGLIYLVIFFLLGRPAVLGAPTSEAGLLQWNFQPPPRVVPVMALLLGLPMLAIWRLSYIRFFTGSALRRRALIVGAGSAGRSLVRDTRPTIRDYEFVGFIDDDRTLHGAIMEGLPVLGSHSALVRLAEARAIDEVIVALLGPVEGELFQALTYCHEQGINISAMSGVYEDMLGQVPVEHLGSQWFLNASKSSFPILYRVLKRLVDILVSLVGLIILALLLPLIALAIYVDCPGPIFYRQERSGKGGKRFWLLKFRSMVPEAEQRGNARWAARGDPRVTRVGRFMRRVRLDELPQFVNILKGEMSIVGPRPERPEFVTQLERQIPFYRTRLSVKPGLTGWAQIRYRYGASVEDALVKLKYDLYYIKNQSITLDLLIIVRTVAVVLAFRGT